MAEVSLDERVDEQCRSCYVSSMDPMGMMRHILDSLGALNVLFNSRNLQVGSSQEISQSTKVVFRFAAQYILDQIVDGPDPLDISAVSNLTKVFPDDKKKADGRGWLPLHWAAATEIVTENDLSNIAKDRPLATLHDHSHLAQQIELQRAATLTETNVLLRADVISSIGQLPLHFIASLKHPRLTNVLTILNSNRVALRVADQNGWLPIHWAASNCSNLDCLRAIADGFPEGVYHLDRAGLLPFHLAGRNYNGDIMRYFLMRNPCFVDVIANDGNNALHESARAFNHEASSLLIAEKPELAISKNFQDQLPIHLMLSQHPSTNSRMQIRQVDTAKLFLENHPHSATMTDANGRLPLHLAVIFNFTYETIDAIYQVYPTASLLEDNRGKCPWQYTEDSAIRMLLLGPSKASQSMGITSSFARFSCK